MIQKIKQKFSSHGSALVVTMIILGIILVSTLSISLVAVQERKASIGENTSNQAYSKAEDGVEKVMQDIRNGGYATVNQLPNCNAGSGRIEGSGYAVELKKTDDTKINCTASDSISDIASVKSIGSAGQNQRAVEVAVAAGCEGGVQVVTNGSSWGSDNYNSLLNFIDNNNGHIIGAVCNSTAAGGRFIDINQVVYNDSANSAQFITGSGVTTIAISCDSATGKCAIGGSNCQNFTVLGSCTCANSCSI